MNDFEKAKKLLNTEQYTCVICAGDKLYTSKRRGVKPLVDCFIEHGEDFVGASAADKVVGKGAAFIYLRLGVRAVYAAVISRAAYSLLQSRSIEIEYDLLVDSIINRQGNGICPFEETVLDIDDENEAYFKIIEKMKELGIWQR